MATHMLPADRRQLRSDLHRDDLLWRSGCQAGAPTVDVEDLVGQEGDALHLIVTHGAEGRPEAQ